MLDGKRSFPRCLRSDQIAEALLARSPEFETQGGIELEWMPPERLNGSLKLYWSIEKPARRFCCQHASVDSVQKGFSLP